RGGRGAFHHGGSGNGSGQEGRGAEGFGGGRQQRAFRLCRTRAPAPGRGRPRGRQDGASSSRVRGNRQGKRARPAAGRLRPAAGGHVEIGQRQLDGNAESAQRSCSGKQPL